MARQRNFNGKTYSRIHHYSSKTTAKQTAKKLRTLRKLKVRIFWEDNGWAIYIRE